LEIIDVAEFAIAVKGGSVAEPCFVRKDSAPAICGVHNAPLVRRQLPDQLIASGYKGFTFLVCPVSGKVLDDAAPTKKDNAEFSA
jgi:hypothetical protein